MAGEHKKAGVTNFWFNDQAYIAFKNTAQVILPALATLYFALSQLWGLPKPEEVVGTITAINTFIGVLVIKAKKDYDNQEQVNPTQ